MVSGLVLPEWASLVDLESGRVRLGEGPDLSGVDPTDVDQLAAAGDAAFPGDVDASVVEPGVVAEPEVESDDGGVVAPVVELRPRGSSWMHGGDRP